MIEAMERDDNSRKSHPALQAWSLTRADVALLWRQFFNDPRASAACGSAG
jgi:hypothetical protein